jgi:hypothetical protein
MLHKNQSSNLTLSLSQISSSDQESICQTLELYQDNSLLFSLIAIVLMENTWYILHSLIFLRIEQSLHIENTVNRFLPLQSRGAL